ncbi:sodium:calcium antiporter [Dictyobacter aurantiacus]|uniref:Sodium/calcium exchanger membrane protein n=1 Tax=Dictyobacter aurantiacus TaxID=1936993 RepID=A0A401ZRJ3_9CHLR|nr:sodium:calcium antiporter [Dictyobacter aurantiacus]GCE09400.1 sodium/calcium exchanger membrane protein [Dictyobacter aurantiacus]
MFHSLPLFALLLIFAVAAVAVWVAGIQLSNTTDVLSSRFKLGQALGGLILLAVATNLPEIAITFSAALSHNLGIAIGNILGGIGIQTVVLVLLDIFGLWRQDALSYTAASLELVLEGILVIAVLIVSIMGTQMPGSLIFAHVAPGALLIAILWVIGIWLLGKARTDLPWQEKGQAPDTLHKKRGEKTQGTTQKWGNARVIIVFAVAAVVTLVAGVILEESGDAIATHIGLSGVLFGSTVLAAATSLPELSTGLASVKAGAYNLAFSDIFGGNAFLPVLFLVATLLSGQAILPQAKNTDIYLAGLGILLTTVYLYGLIFRPKKQILHMGIDSLVVLVLYILGIAGLFAIATLS